MLNKDIIRAASSPDSERRKQAIIALGRSKQHDALPHLSQLAQSDPQPDLRELARKGIAYIQKHAPQETYGRRDRSSDIVLHEARIDWSRRLLPFFYYAFTCFLLLLAALLVLMWPLIEAVSTVRVPGALLDDLMLAYYHHTQLNSLWLLLAFSAKWTVYGIAGFAVASTVTHLLNYNRAEPASYLQLISRSWPWMLSFMPGLLLFMGAVGGKGSILQAAASSTIFGAWMGFAYGYTACIREAYDVGGVRATLSTVTVMLAYFAFSSGLVLATAF
jgi:hypothetical protein